MGLAAVFLALTHAHSHIKTHPDILITPRFFVPNENKESKSCASLPPDMLESSVEY